MASRRERSTQAGIGSRAMPSVYVVAPGDAW